MLKVFSDERKKEYPNFEAADEPLKNPIKAQTVAKVRAYRHERIKQKVIEHDCAAILLYDPLNIRYATDCSNMQVWTLHNAARYTMVCADGPTICFEYSNAMHVAEGLDKVDEVRPAISWFYFSAGPRVSEKVKLWAAEVADVVRQHGGGNMRLAVDKMEPAGVDALRAEGIEIVEGQALTETARMIKSADEIELMRWTIKVCEQGMWRMREHSVPVNLKTKSGRNCITRISATAANGLKPACWPSVSAPIRGFRNVRTMWARMAICCRLIPIW